MPATCATSGTETETESTISGVKVSSGRPVTAATPPDGFARLRNVLAEHAKWLPGRLVLVHGDTHIYRDDEPLSGLRRVEVYGSPFVAWLRASTMTGELRVEQTGQY